MKLQKHTIVLNDKQLAHLNSFLSYALKVYQARTKYMKEDTEISLLELIATIKEQTK